MSGDHGAAGTVPGAPAAMTWRSLLPRVLATGLVWLGGSAVVSIAQSSSDRRLATAASAAAGIAIILFVTVVTRSPGQRYIRSIVAAIAAVSLTSTWLVRRLGITGVNVSFSSAAAVERIALPLLVVLLLPLVVQASARRVSRPRELWEDRAAQLRSLSAMDWVMLAYAIVVTLPALLLGLAHHNRLLFVAQDLGLVVFFVFMYFVGRAVEADTGRGSAEEVIEVLLLLAAARALFLGWPQIEPLYVYLEAACAGALAFALLRPRQTRILTLGLAVTLLAVEGVMVQEGSGSSIAVDLAVAVALVGYVAVRLARLVPAWLIAAVAVVGLIGFVVFTSDGAALRGQYHGPDPSNRGRTYEARLVRKAVGQSPLSLALGRGFGGTIDERGAFPIWRKTLQGGGRDLAAVQEIHPLPYSFLLKAGLLGLAWFFLFMLTLAVVAFRALERAVGDRSPSLVLYAALPVIGLIQAFAGATRLQANPLNALALGILVSCLAVPAAAAQASDSPATTRSSAAS